MLLKHTPKRFSAYLHLDTIEIVTGQTLTASKRLGTIDNTSATTFHLHLSYLIDQPQPTLDERKSHNPLELLPHLTPPTEIPIDPMTFTIDNSSIELELPLQQMTMQHLTLAKTGVERNMDYTEIVTLSTTPRDAQTQIGIRLDMARPTKNRFLLTLSPDPTDFPMERLIALDFTDQILIDITP